MPAITTSEYNYGEALNLNSTIEFRPWIPQVVQPCP